MKKLTRSDFPDPDIKRIPRTEHKKAEAASIQMTVPALTITWPHQTVDAWIGDLRDYVGIDGDMPADEAVSKAIEISIKESGLVGWLEEWGMIEDVFGAVLRADWVIETISGHVIVEVKVEDE